MPIIYDNDFVPGFRFFPRELTNDRGWFFESKNTFLRFDFSNKSDGGNENTSMMHAICSCSFSPGKIGKPVYSSAKN